MCQTKIFGLIQATNMFKHISTNTGATIKASRKTAHDKVFYMLWTKGHFFPENGDTIKKGYSPRSVYWYQCFSVWKTVGAKSLVHSRLASPMISPLHILTLLMHVSQILLKVPMKWTQLDRN